MAPLSIHSVIVEKVNLYSWQQKKLIDCEVLYYCIMRIRENGVFQ